MKKIKRIKCGKMKKMYMFKWLGEIDDWKFERKRTLSGMNEDK